MSDDTERLGIDLAMSRSDDRTGGVEPSFSGVLSFMRRRYTKSLDNVDVAVVGLPFDLATTSRPGARLGPRAVREASSMIAWDRVHGWDYDPFERLAVVDYGDVLVDASQPEALTRYITDAFGAIYTVGARTLMLGGDHYASYPVLCALREQYDAPLALVHFDAHSDTWGAGEPKGIDHGTMFYHAANEGIIDPSISVQLGLRTHNPDTHGFNIMTAEAVAASTPDAIADYVRSIVGDRPVYLTFDIDCLDPAFAPGTGTPVMGGLSSLQAQQILRGLRGINIVSGDVVEVAPAYDVSQITAIAAATIGANIIALMSASREFADSGTP
ncbi:MAG: agmatinase [Pseudomonadota bacterium]